MHPFRLNCASFCFYYFVRVVEIMKKALFAFFVVGVPLGLNSVVAQSVRNTEKMSDAELDKFIKGLVGETEDDASASASATKKISNKKKKSAAPAVKKEQKKAGKAAGAASAGTTSQRRDARIAEKDSEPNLSAETSKQFPTGFSVELGLMQSWNSAKNDTKEWYFIPIAGQGFKDSEHKFTAKTDKGRLAPVVGVGYSFLFNDCIWLGLAGEISFGGSATNTTEKTLSASTLKKFVEKGKVSSTSYAIKVKPGYLFQDFGMVVYGILGVRWRKVEFNLESMQFGKMKDSLDKPMLVLGIGFEKQIMDRLSLCFEYEHCWKKSSGIAKARDLKENSGFKDIGRKREISLRTNSIKFGVKYYF